jgi:hypothetical protein
MAMLARSQEDVKDGDLRRQATNNASARSLASTVRGIDW